MPRYPRFYITKEREQHYLWRAKIDPEFRGSRLFKRIKLIRRIQLASVVVLVVGFLLVAFLGRSVG
jgi:hypothetical protein